MCLATNMYAPPFSIYASFNLKFGIIRRNKNKIKVKNSLNYYEFV